MMMRVRAHWEADSQVGAQHDHIATDIQCTLALLAAPLLLRH